MISHRKVRRAWYEGRITAWDEFSGAEYCPGIQDYVLPERDRIYLDGELLSPVMASAYHVLNKPADVITTTSDPQGRSCLTPWLEVLPAGVFPVGRLDRETTGALFLTDDGDLSYMLLHPDFHVHKCYELTLSTRREAVEEGLELLTRGVDIGDDRGVARALSLTRVSEQEESVTVRLVLAEGRNRQIRKMCRAAGLHLEHLHRSRFGSLHVDDVAAGACRELSPDEVERMWEACGGREVPWLRTVTALVQNVAHYRSQGQPHERLEAWIEAHRDVLAQIAPQASL